MITAEDLDKVSEKYDLEYEKFKNDIKKPNILIIGATGVGKSSLINKIFGKNVAKVSNIKPETRGVNRIEIPNKPIVLFDTEGFELGNEGSEIFENIIEDFVNKKAYEVDKEEKIHLVWHVIDGTSARITDYDKNIQNSIKSKNIPLATIFSKCDSAGEDELDAMIKELDNSLSFAKVYSKETNMFLTTAENQEVEDPNINLDKLINWSIDKLPEQLRFSFVSSQKHSIEIKDKEASKIIKLATTAAAAVGGSPIPFSDAPLIIASQVGMIYKIVKIYDIDFDVKTFMKSTGTNTVVSNLGRTLVGNILKFIPGFGSVVGGVISAGVAGTITFAMGSAINKLLKEAVLSQLTGSGSFLEEALKGDLFQTYFNEFFNKKTNS